MMAANFAPNILGSRPVDASGTELTGDRRERNLKLKSLREERMQLESAENAARDTKDIKLGAFTRKLQAVQNDMRLALTQLRNKAEDEKNKETDKEKKAQKEKDLQQIDTIIDAVDNFWNNLQVSTREKVETAVAVEEAANRTLEIINPPVNGEDFTKVEKASLEFTQAVYAYRNWENSSKAVADNKVEYNNVMMGVQKQSKLVGLKRYGGFTVPFLLFTQSLFSSCTQ